MNCDGYWAREVHAIPRVQNGWPDLLFWVRKDFQRRGIHPASKEQTSNSGHTMQGHENQGKVLCTKEQALHSSGLSDNLTRERTEENFELLIMGRKLKFTLVQELFPFKEDNLSPKSHASRKGRGLRIMITELCGLSLYNKLQMIEGKKQFICRKGGMRRYIIIKQLTQKKREES